MTAQLRSKAIELINEASGRWLWGCTHRSVGFGCGRPPLSQQFSWVIPAEGGGRGDASKLEQLGFWEKPLDVTTIASTRVSTTTIYYYKWLYKYDNATEVVLSDLKPW